MKTKSRHAQIEQRRKRMVIPFVYMIAEITLVWLVLSFINVSFDLRTWGSVSFVILYLAGSYSLYKTFLVYKRQEEYKRV